MKVFKSKVKTIAAHLERWSWVQVPLGARIPNTTLPRNGPSVLGPLT